MYNLKIIVSMVLQGKKRPIAAIWIDNVAQQHEIFDEEVLGFGEINLPIAC